MHPSSTPRTMPCCNIRTSHAHATFAHLLLQPDGSPLRIATAVGCFPILSADRRHNATLHDGRLQGADNMGAMQPRQRD